MTGYLPKWLADEPSSQTSPASAGFYSSHTKQIFTAPVVRQVWPQLRIHSVWQRRLLNGKDAGSGGEWRPWGKKLSRVNLIILVTVRPGQTQQPITLHLKYKQCKPQQRTHRHKRRSLPSLLYIHRAHRNTSISFISGSGATSLNESFGDQNKNIKL